MRVLHFVPRLCWPLNTGAKLRNYHLARELSRRAQLTLLTFSENGEEMDTNSRGTTRHAAFNQSVSSQDKAASSHAEAQGEALFPPELFYERVRIIRRASSYTPAKIIRGALGHTPLPVLNYTTSAMKQALTTILEEQDFDVVQVESIHLMAYLPILRAARSRPLVILDWHNIESELIRRYSEREVGRLRRAYAQRTAQQLNYLEARAVTEFDAHLVVSDRDGAKLLEHSKDASVFLIENGVDTAYYSDERIKEAHAAQTIQGGVDSGAESFNHARGRAASVRPNRIVFVASMDYHANVDGAVSFAHEVWPQLHEQRPELIFTIVGRDPAPEVRQLAELPGIEVTGTVEDVRPYYQEAIAAIIPLRVGGGSRLKILEAMAAGVPVVSTTLGAEGLEVLDGENILIANTGPELRAAVMTVVENRERREKLAGNGRALVSARYDWSRLGADLFETYRNLTGNRPLAMHMKR
jgi:glycosyltransferase involved in cell wall biosynthesis